MKLFYSKGACSLVVRILLHELNIENVEYEKVDLKAHKTEQGEDYYKINPKGSVPVLQLDDGTLLTENAVIQQYLVNRHKAYNLLPKEEEFRHYQVLEWLNFITTDIHKGFGPFFNPAVTAEMKEDIFKPVLAKKFAYIDKQLAGKTYLMGDKYTLPDGYLFVMLLWAHNIKLMDPAWSNLARFHEQMKKRPAVQKAFQEEGLPI